MLNLALILITSDAFYNMVMKQLKCLPTYLYDYVVLTFGCDLKCLSDEEVKDFAKSYQTPDHLAYSMMSDMFKDSDCEEKFGWWVATNIAQAIDESLESAITYLQAIYNSEDANQEMKIANF